MINKVTDNLSSGALVSGLIDFTVLPLGLFVDITPQNIPSYYDGWAYSTDNILYKTFYNSDVRTEEFTSAGLKSIYVRGFRLINGEEILADTFKKEDVTLTNQIVTCSPCSHPNVVRLMSGTWTMGSGWESVSISFNNSTSPFSIEELVLKRNDSNTGLTDFIGPETFVNGGSSHTSPLFSSDGSALVWNSSTSSYDLHTECCTIETPTVTVSPTLTLTPTVTVSPTLTLTPTVTVSPTLTPTVTVSPTLTLTPTVTVSPTLTPTVTVSPTLTLTPTPTVTVSPTLTLTVTVSPTLTPTMTLMHTSIGDISANAFIVSSNNLSIPDGSFFIGDIRAMVNLETDTEDDQTSIF